MNSRQASTDPLTESPEVTAREAGLRYVSDRMPGIERRRCGGGFTYRDVRGETIRNPQARKRFAALVIPPAWTEVWICPDPEGHLQVTGRDDRGRKQYRYHPKWREVRGATKFDRLLEFGAALPGLRRLIDEDLERSGMGRRRVLAAVVKVMEESLIRVGNDEYARENGSYGLTTLRRRHAEVDGSVIRLEFTAKSGLRCEAEVDDPQLAKIVRRCQELRGQELFTYLDAEGTRRDVGSGDVNSYLQEATGQPFTAKDFRTWAGTVAVAGTLRKETDPVGELTATEANRRVVEAVRHAAEDLGNTLATCRKFYVHPAVEESFLNGTLQEFAREPAPRSPRGLDVQERFTLALLRNLSAES